MPQIKPRGRNYRQEAQRRRPNYRSQPRRKTQSGWSMKLGAWAHARLREAQYDSLSRRIIQSVAVIALLAVFLTIAVAVGLVNDTGKAITEVSAKVTRSVGLSVKGVDVVAFGGRTMTNAQKTEVEAIAGIIPDDIMFSVNPKLIRDRVMDLPWVESVIVRRLWPDHIQILVTPRAANALWQVNGKLTYIDASGKVLGAADPAKVRGLPLVMGVNAGVEAPKMFEILANHKAIASKIYALELVGSRRWNLRLRSGAEILLPEQNYEQALASIEELQAQYRLLDRNFARLDVRRPGYLLIRPSAEITLAAHSSV